MRRGAIVTDSTPKREENDDEFEGPSELFEPIESIRRVIRFWKTRNAVMSGERLYDFSKSKLDKLGYLGPWKFNLVQSSIAAFPSVLIIALAHLLRNLGMTDGETKPSEQSSEFLTALAVPFILMLTAYVVGRASFFRSDSTKLTRSIASRVFLYLDGAYGFYPQLALTTLLTIMLLQDDSGPFLGAVNLVGIWQLIVYMKTIPAELFGVLGYARTEEVVDSGKSITLFTRDTETASPVVIRDYPPIWKYRLVILVVVPFITIAVFLLMLLLSLFLDPLVALFK
jgi:hypothetical protein